MYFWTNTQTMRIIFLIIFILTTHSSFATGDSLRYLLPQDTVFLSINYRNQKLFKHQFEKGQTLYSLAKFYGLTINKLYEYNPQLKNTTIHIGDMVTVPIPNKAILRKLKPHQESKDFAKIYYIVKKGDTVYGISKRHFKITEEELKRNNNLESIELSPGQLLHVGWMKTDGIDKDWQYPKGVSGDIAAENQRNKSDFLSKSYLANTKIQKGKAQWDSKDSFAPSGLFCLHKYAPTGSIIRLENPITKNVAYVKVVGKIPMNYEQWVVIVVSKDVAKALRAIDDKFFIKAEYFIN